MIGNYTQLDFKDLHWNVTVSSVWSVCFVDYMNVHVCCPFVLLPCMRNAAWPFAVDIHATVSCLISPQPRSFVPGFLGIPQLCGHSAARRSARYQPELAISWWAVADTPLRTDYSIRLCSANHPVSVPCTRMLISGHAKAWKVAG